MKIQIKESDIYIPNWHNNRELPDAEQIKIYYKYLTTDQRKTYVHTEPLKVSAEKGKDSEIEIVIKQDTEGIAKASIYRIDGLETMEGKKIDTVAKLYSTIDSSEIGMLIAEVENYLLSANRGIDEKNS